MNKSEFLLASLVLGFFQILIGKSFGIQAAIVIGLFMSLGGIVITIAVFDKKIQRHDFNGNQRGIPTILWIIGAFILIISVDIKVFFGSESSPTHWVDIPLSLGLCIGWWGFILILFRSYRKPKK